MYKGFDILIVGAGISGSVLAERFASVQNKRVLVVEKRDHIGGNCYDYIDKVGILVPKYGPHFFHTNFEDVWRYVNKFSVWQPYEHRVLSYVEGKLVPIPVNIETVNKLCRECIRTEAEMADWLQKNTIPIKHPKNSEESALSRVGPVLYEKLFKNYTKKHWDLWPIKLDASVMDRIPVRVNHDCRYFSDKYQAMPKYGYTKLFERMLNHKNIRIELNVDFLKIRDELKNFKKIFYTGPIDAFFEYKHGKLEYRSLRFDQETLSTKFFQSRAVINYPNDFDFIRITEPKHATNQKLNKTTIIKEYSKWGGEPYYPVLSKKNISGIKKYTNEINKLKNVYFIGRLANYVYINMDQAFKNALGLFRKTNE